MSKRLRDGLVLVSALMLFFLWSELSVYLEPESDAEKHIRLTRMVKPGMRRQAVVEIIGKPNDFDVWDLGIWRSKDSSFWVHFDNNGFVVDTTMHDYRTPKPLQALINWFTEIRQRFK